MSYNTFHSLLTSFYKYYLSVCCDYCRLGGCTLLWKTLWNQDRPSISYIVLRSSHPRSKSSFTLIVYGRAPVTTLALWYCIILSRVMSDCFSVKYNETVVNNRPYLYLVQYIKHLSWKIFCTSEYCFSHINMLGYTRSVKNVSAQ